MKTSARLINVWMAIFSVFVSGCGNDDEPKIPTDAIAVNMMIGDSETTIGGSDVYINSSLNFTTSYCGISDLGKKGGFSKNPNITQIAQEVAVTPGNFYQIVLADDISKVANARAFPINANYYNVYVDSWIYDKDNDIAGAKISYAECYPDTRQLPDWDSQIDINMDSDNYYYTATYTFPKGCNIDDYVEVYDKDGYIDTIDALEIEIKGNQIKFSYPPHLSYPVPHRAIVLVRHESLYSRVALKFNYPDAL